MIPMNIHLSGVGGQGIGLLSGVLGAACQAAGHRIHGCDTHGLAQRGGTVMSHLRLGDLAKTPRVPLGQADLVVALERLEALRATLEMLRPGGRVVYYDARFQPGQVRVSGAPYPSTEDVANRVAERGGTVERVFLEDLADPRMQNIALLGRLAAIGAVEGVTADVLENAITATVPPALLEKNLEVFRRALSA